jgi:hypothetical protein
MARDAVAGLALTGARVTFLTGAALVVACAAQAPARRLAEAAMACDVQGTAPSADTTPIYATGAADRGAVPSARNFMPSLGGPGRIVVVEFVVDTLGRPDLCTASIRRESHRGLGDQLLAAVADWRYTPAEHEGEKVRQLVAVVVGAP